MDITGETLLIMVVLIPGFVSSALLDMVVTRKPKDSGDKLIEALMLSFLNYVVVAGILRIDLTTDVDALRRVVKPGFVVASLISALLLPLLMGRVARDNWHMRLFQWLRITNRTNRMNVWQDAFADHPCYVICNLTGGRRVFGWPLYTSDSALDEAALYLQDPAWIVEDKYVELGIHGLLLVEKEAIESIEFTNLTEKAAPARKETANEPVQA